MDLDTNCNSRSNKAKKKISTPQKKCSREGQLELGSTREVKDTTTVQPLERSHIEEPSWPHFAEEDYIVFCFKEDGDFDVVKDGYNKSEASSCIDCRTRSSRPVNRKVSEKGLQLHYVEDTRTVERCRNDGDSIMSDQKH
ncbi:protein BREAKING OF ASYMMETRY IN THE STOMATAL LINEAGE [Ziziphus jujuba]|uniref:Protein BREAKING OF ASYMMETRY IN THE STOMATAL LINEAGE n=1 Tax=Ziziphus jujuba TaxID=326968 RepID=A0ABM4A2P9_ZIZJJ|nr:protein BREAKING OF ASYMMETRY IN THE STOMATAL LINEAGE [Ziziphus jujuba]